MTDFGLSAKLLRVHKTLGDAVAHSVWKIICFCDKNERFHSFHAKHRVLGRKVTCDLNWFITSVLLLAVKDDDLC